MQVTFLRWTTLCLLMVFLAGCHQQTDMIPPPNTMFTPASATMQAQTEQVSQQFLQALRQGEYLKAEKLMTSQYRLTTSPAHLHTQMQTINHPLQSARNFQYVSVQSALHGNQAVLRAQFLANDGKTYHTNIILSKSPAGWLVDRLVPPVTHRAPQQALHESQTNQ